MRYLAGPMIVAGAILLVAGAILAGAGIVTAAIRENAGQQGVTEELRFAYGGGAIVGILGAALMGWGIIGGMIAVRYAERERTQ
jgi:hypothetical protein